MDQHQRRVVRNARKFAQSLNLDGRTSESFHTVQTRGMQYSPARILVAEPRNIDAQILITWPFCVERQNVQPAAPAFRHFSESSSRGKKISEEVLVLPL